MDCGLMSTTHTVLSRRRLSHLLSMEMMNWKQLHSQSPTLWLNTLNLKLVETMKRDTQHSKDNSEISTSAERRESSLTAKISSMEGCSLSRSRWKPSFPESSPTNWSQTHSQENQILTIFTKWLEPTKILNSHMSIHSVDGSNGSLQLNRKNGTMLSESKLPHPQLINS